MEFHHILKLEEDFWKLKSRVDWLNDGDANTKFFHLSTINRRRFNCITTIQDHGGNWITSPISLGIILLNIIKIYFQTQKISSSKNTSIKPSNVLSSEDQSSLTNPLQDWEITNAIESFKPLKVPGPDELHLFFYQKYWTIIGKSVMFFL